VARDAAGGVGGANDRSARSARAAAHDPYATVMSPLARRADVVSQDAVLFSFLFGPLRRQSTPNTDEIKECGETTYENHEHRKHHLLDPPRGLARDRPAVWVMPDARGPGRLFASHWEPDGRQRKSTSSLEIRWMARCCSLSSTPRCLGLTWGRVDRSRGVVRLERTKSGRLREVPLGLNADAVLARRWTNGAMGYCSGRASGTRSAAHRRPRWPRPASRASGSGLDS
jgi:hypothetical protein